MKNKEIKKYYKKNIELINKYNKFYYDKSKPLISDQKYDELRKEILILEKNMIF